MRPLSRTIVRVLAVLAGAVGAVVAPSAALAHTDVDYSVPADGTSVDEPVGEIVVAFTAAVELVGNGFEVLDPDGNILQPLAVTDDGIVFRLPLDPPLAGGPVGVRYEIAARDGHVLRGSFSFTVAVEALAETEPPPTEPANIPPATEAPPRPTVAPSPTTPPPPTVAPSPTTPPPASAIPPTAAPATTSPTPGSDLPSGTDVRAAGVQGDDGGTSAGVIVAIAAAVALAATGFVLLRTRSSG